MLVLLLELIQALTFSVTVGRYGQHATLRYPVADKVSWVEVCVEAEGYYENRPGAEGWNSMSCWVPRFKVEELRLDPGTVTIAAHLNISEDGYRSWLHTPVINVRPRPTPEP